MAARNATLSTLSESLQHSDFEVFHREASSAAAKCHSAAHVMIYALNVKKRRFYNQKAHVMVRKDKLQVRVTAGRGANSKPASMKEIIFHTRR